MLLYLCVVLAYLAQACDTVCGEFVTLFGELDELDKSKFDLASMSFSDKFESPVEKKLRETGESLKTWTQTRFRDSGTKIVVWPIRKSDSIKFA
nr:hypothetical protein CFP56_08921 [Quercus suber]